MGDWRYGKVWDNGKVWSNPTARQREGKRGRVMEFYQSPGMYAGAFSCRGRKAGAQTGDTAGEAQGQGRDVRQRRGWVVGLENGDIRGNGARGAVAGRGRVLATLPYPERFALNVARLRGIGGHSGMRGIEGFSPGNKNPRRISPGAGGVREVS